MTDAPARLSLHLAMTAKELQRAAAAVEAFAQAQDWPVGLKTHIQLAIEEIGVNVVNYGRDENRAGDPAIDIEVSSSPDAVTVEITDDGRPFNPLEDAPTADTTSPMDERPIGGLGVHLVRTLMSDVRYRRENDRNRLTMVKRRTE